MTTPAPITTSAVVLVGLLTSTASAADWSITCLADGIEATAAAGRVRVTVREPNIVRIRRTTRKDWNLGASIAVLPAATAVAAPAITEGAEAVELATPAMRVRFDRRTGRITIADATGRTVLGEGDHTVTTGQCGTEPVQQVVQGWTLQADESLYGMGSVLADGLDLRPRLAKEPLRIKVDNTYYPMSCWVSSAGYGLLWDSPAVSVAGIAGDVLSITTELADEEDYYVVVAPLADVVRGFHRLTGTAPLPPRWAFGYVQSKERYCTQAEITDVAKRLRRDRFPADAVVQDWQYWGEFGWNGMRFDSEIFPDPAGMVRELHGMDLHLLLSVWSNFPVGSPMYKALKPQNALLDDTMVWGDAYLYDTWSAEARATVWARAKKNLLPTGVDGWWLDHTDFMGYQDGTGQTKAGDVRRVFNSYVMGACQPYYDGQRTESSDKRVMILTRSAYPGVQRYGAFFWTGDVWGTWESLRKHQAAALNAGLSGVAYWNSDIGGFFVVHWENKIQKPAEDYPELYLRWFQFATFTALFRSHGTQTPREPWCFGSRGEPIYDTLVAFATLRYRLLPYLYSQAWNITDHGAVLMRALPMEFPQDPAVRDLAGQWMFGPSLMVTPITAPMAEQTKQAVTLPAGTRWYDFWTGRSFTGGQAITQPTVLTTIPLHVRAGSIIPFGPEVQSTAEKPADPLEIRVYPGADATFTLYEDAGDGYAYERGERSLIRFTWDDAATVLRVAERTGSFPGMLHRRHLRVVLVRGGIGGIGPTAKVDAEVDYTGEALEIPLAGR